MSVNYYSNVYLGFAISEPDLIETQFSSEAHVQCEHPEAVGTKFCPVCGTPADKRVVHERKTRTFLKGEVWGC